MKQLLLSLFLCLFSHGYMYAQDDFERYVKEQEKAFKEYSDRIDSDFKAYHDSLNSDFGRYLAEVWPDCPLVKPVQPIRKPVPPEVYDPFKRRPEPSKLPVRGEVDLPISPRPLSVPPGSNNVPLPNLPPTLPDNRVESTFFGTTVAFDKPSFVFPRLEGVGEAQIAAYWNGLSHLPYTGWVARIWKLKDMLALNDWGMFLLIQHSFLIYNPHGSTNEQVIFSVFTLNQMGYRAKIGKKGQMLLPLIAFGCDVYNTTYFDSPTERGVRYSVVNMGHHDLASIQCCSMDYGAANRLMDVSLSHTPNLSVNRQTKLLKDKHRDYQLHYNKNLVDLYATLPCVNFALYAQAALDETLWESLKQQIVPLLQGLSQEEAVNTLLHFVQFAFQYKTDDEQFHYEKWFFAEETVDSAFSDCEDRSILFAQLVRRLLGMPVVLVHYPGRHLATAVHFSNAATTGDYLTVDRKKFLLCDPTYYGATLGMEMPQLKQTPVEVIRLK